MASCGQCTTGTYGDCSWNENIVPPACVPRAECDFHYESDTETRLVSDRLATVSVCKETPSQCGTRAPDGAVLELNPDRGMGCTTHDQCGTDAGAREQG